MNLRVMGAAFVFGAALYGGYSGPAFAADLGGDCCSDLDERVAELEATTARKGNRKVSLNLYGQVTTALMYWDNGDRSDTYITDLSNQTSRFGFEGSAKINSTLSAGFKIEVAATSAASNAVTVEDDDGGQAGDGAVAVRLANWYLNDTRLGRITVGRLNMATDGVAEIDLGGTTVVTQSGLYFGNAITVNGTGNALSKYAVGDFEFDRNNAIRYDTPTFGGFVASASWGEDDRWDVTLRYAGEFNGFRVAGGIAYGVDTDELATTFEQRPMVIGSLSVMHVGTGLFVSGTGGQRTTEVKTGDDFDETYWSVRGGIAKNWFGLGNTVLYGEYHRWENGSNLDQTAEIKGLGIVQNIDAASMELFLAYKNNTVDVPGADDINIVLSGARIRF